MTIACAAIGFMDDYFKLVHKRSLGLAGRWKMLLLLGVTAGLGYAAHRQGLSTDVYVPLIDIHVDLGPAYYVLLFLVVAGGANAVNLTDGLDGLAAGTMTIAMLTYTAMMVVAFLSPAGLTREGDPSRIDLAIIGAALVGGCVGFLWYNAYPADVFMGDTGSFGLGGALAAMAVFTKTEFLLVLIGGDLRDRGAVGRDPGDLVQADRQAGAADGADPPPLRDAGVDREQDHRALLDRCVDVRRQRLRPLLPGLLEVPVTRERYLVIGLRRSGLAACEAIRRLWPDAEVLGADPAGDVDTGRLARIGVEWVTGTNDVPVADVTALIKSPGVPGEAQPVRDARAAGVPVWGEVELAARMLPNPIVGITGTNGKTTTTELIGAMLHEGGLPVEVAGNVGRALTELPGRADPEAWVVAELSSFQLEDIDTFRARVAVILNVTPDHLDRHGSMAEYTRCKLRLLENQRPGDVAILNGDDAVLRSERLPGRGRAAVVLARPVRPDRLAACRASVAATTSRTRWPRRWPPRRSASPRTTATARCARSTPRPTGSSWPPTGDGVRFVNDSKATNPESAMMALTAFDDPLRLILGGSLKGGSFDRARRRRRRRRRWPAST